MKAIHKKSPIQIYLEYVNDWLTVEKMAEYYDISAKELSDIIDAGRWQHNFWINK